MLAAREKRPVHQAHRWGFMGDSEALENVQSPVCLSVRQRFLRHRQSSHHLINQPADVHDRQSGDHIFAAYHRGDKGLDCSAQVLAHQAPRGSKGPALDP